MEPGAGTFPNRIQVRDTGLAPLISHDPPAHVVRRGNNRNGVTSDVNSKRQAFFMDIRETLPDEFGIAVGDIQEHAVVSRLLHLGVDGACNHITKCQVFQWVIFFHKGLAPAINQSSPFTTNRFGNQEILGSGVVQAGGVKLHEFQISQLRPGAISHGQSIAGGHIRIAGINIDFAASTGAEQNHVGQESVRFLGVIIQHIDTPAGSLLEQCHRSGADGAMLGDEIHGEMVFKDGDIRILFSSGDQGLFQGATGHVLSMHDAVAAVSSFSTQIKRSVFGALPVELDTDFQQLANPLRTGAHNQLHHFRVTQPITRIQRVLHVKLKGIVRTQDRGNSSLGVVGAGLQLIFLGHHGHGTKLRRFQSETQARHSTANH